jgi:hypothetical protein
MAKIICSSPENFTIKMCFTATTTSSSDIMICGLAPMQFCCAGHGLTASAGHKGAS